MAQLFADEPVLVERTREVASRCAFNLSEIRYRYPAERLPDGRTSSAWLRELTLRGACERFGGDDGVPPAIREQIDRELALIDELDYGGYFLTMWEIVRYCRQEGILCQGRGSAANSVVCYCLGITAVDPTRGRAAVRAVPLARAARAAGHRPRHHARPPRGGDPARLSQVRPRPRRHGGQRRALPRALGGAGSGQGARAVRDGDRPARPAPVALRPARRGGADARRARPGLADPRSPLPAVRADPGLSPPSVDPPGRLPAGPRAGPRPGADRERHDARPDGDPVGQGRPGGPRPLQGRSAGPRRADPARPELPAARPALRPRAVARPDSTRRSADLRPDLPRRHGRRLPDREPRPDGDAAAAPAAEVLRPGHRGEHRAARPDLGRHGAPLPAAPQRRGRGRLSAPVPRAGAEEDARRAALPGAGDEAGDGGGRLHAGRGGPVAPRHGGVAPQRGASSGTATGW